MRKKPWVIWMATWLVHVPLWLSFAANIGWREIVAGSISAAIATVAVAMYAWKGKVCFTLRWRDIVQAWRVPWSALTGTGTVLYGLFRQLFTRDGAPSFLGAVSFDVGGMDDPAAAGRRALAVAYTSFTPNSVVLGIVPGQRLLLYHEIIPDDVSTTTRKLGANP